MKQLMNLPVFPFQFVFRSKSGKQMAVVNLTDSPVNYFYSQSLLFFANGNFSLMNDWVTARLMKIIGKDEFAEMHSKLKISMDIYISSIPIGSCIPIKNDLIPGEWVTKFPDFFFVAFFFNKVGAEFQFNLESYISSIDIAFGLHQKIWDAEKVKIAGITIPLLGPELGQNVLKKSSRQIMFTLIAYLAQEIPTFSMINLVSPKGLVKQAFDAINVFFSDMYSIGIDPVKVIIQQFDQKFSIDIFENEEISMP